MFNVQKKDELIKLFTETAREVVGESCKDLDLFTFMDESKVDLIRESVAKIQNCIIASIPEGLAVPKVSLYVTPTGNPVNLIGVTVTNRVIADKKFKYSETFVKHNVVDAIANFFIATYIELLIEGMISENLEEVNAIVKDLVAKAGIGYEVEVVSPLGQKGRKVAAISDDKVIFVADEDRALDLDDILILNRDSELVTEELFEEAFNNAADEFATAQTTEQLVALHGGLLISYIADINKQVKAMTLLKKVCSKDAKKLTGSNDTLAYYNDGKVFAIIARRDGHLEVVLSPFEIETMRKSDVDVLKAI